MLRLFRTAFLAGILPAFLLMLGIQTSQAGSSVWQQAPATSDWNTAGNWSAGGPPNGPADNATFTYSTRTAVSISANTQVYGIVFGGVDGPDSFTITANTPFTLTISGFGISAGSSTFQNFVTTADGAGNHAAIVFNNSATAGSGRTRLLFTNKGGLVSGANGGATEFEDTSSAGNGTFNNNGGAASGAFGGRTAFFGSSTAANGTFINNGGAISGGSGGDTVFFDSSTAGDATFVANAAAVGGARAGFIVFYGSSTAGAGTFVVNGAMVGGASAGYCSFYEDADGGTARFEFFDGGELDISGRNPPGITTGSIEANGNVFLGAFNLTVGNNNLSTVFSGVVQDGGLFGGTGSSLTKIGTGTLTLSGASTYTGSTIINAGKMTVNGSITSDVTVNSGATLGGSGTTRSVTVKPGGKVVPGDPQILTVAGNYEQDDTATLHLDIAGTAPGDFDQLVVSGNATLSPDSVLEVNFIGGFAPKQGDTFDLIVAASVTGDFGTIEIQGLQPGFEFDLALDGDGHLQLTALNDGVLPSRLLNISTRMQVLMGDNVLIGGFIITGNAPKKVIVRAIGPALVAFGLADALADPVLALHMPDMTVIANDNWKDTQQTEIEATGLQPSEDLESAIVATLAPGAYTAIVSGKDDSAGIGLVEVYDLDQAADSTLTNISTRGFVDTGDNVMIGGLIIGGGASQVLVRAIGPELTGGVAGALEDTTLELHDKDGALITSNDDWKETQQSDIEATGLAPTDDRESAILATLTPDSYTAIVRGKNDTTGVSLVEVYNLSP